MKSLIDKFKDLIIKYGSPKVAWDNCPKQLQKELEKNYPYTFPILYGRKYGYRGFICDQYIIRVTNITDSHHLKLHRGFPKKGKITGYEPDIYESVAESMRLFILNPGLLHIIAPERCEYIVKSGLKPVVTEDWDKVLENAPAEYSRQILKNYLGFHC